MRDVGERAAMHQGGRAFEGLHQVGGDRLLQQHGHRTVRLQVAGRHVCPVARLSNDHAPESRLQIGKVAGQAEYGHYLGRDGDVEPVFPREAVGNAAQAAHDRAQRAVVHVEAAAPGDPPRVDPQRITPIDRVIDHGGQQVVG